MKTTIRYMYQYATSIFENKTVGNGWSTRYERVEHKIEKGTTLDIVYDDEKVTNYDGKTDCKLDLVFSSGLLQYTYTAYLKIMLADKALQYVGVISENPQITRIGIGYTKIETVNALGFAQIISNELGGHPSLYAVVTEPVHAAYEYLHGIYIGTGKKSYCPFVCSIEKQNMYFAKVYDFKFSILELGKALIEIEKTFLELSPEKTSTTSKTDLTTVVGVFSHELNVSENAYEVMEKVRIALRTRFLKRGLMVACTHPFHPQGGRPGSPNSDSPMFVSKVPMFVVRRMNKDDHIFMNTDEEVCIFKSFFS